jgi:WD40 repeat protein
VNTVPRRILVPILLALIAGATPGSEPLARTDLLGDPLPPHAVARMGSVRLRYQKPLGPMTFVADGKTLVVATHVEERALWLWNLADGKLLRKIELGALDAIGIACTPDGRLAAVLNYAGEVEIVSLTTGKLIRSLDTQRRRVSSIALSPDGTTLAGGCEGFHGRSNPVLLWEVASGKKLLTLDGHRSTVRQVVFSADGKRLLSASHDVPGTPGTIRPELLPGSLCVWNIPEGTLRRRLRQKGENCAFSGDGKTLACQGQDEKIHLWDLDVDREIARLPLEHSAYLFLPDGKTLATGSDREGISLWDAASGRRIRRFRGYLGSGALVCAVSPDGKVLASQSGYQAQDYSIRLWDVARGEELRPQPGHQGAVTCLAFSPDGKRVLSGSKDQSVRLWETRTGKETGRYDRHRASITAVAFSPDGRTAASGDLASTVHLWDIATGKLLHRLQPQPLKEGEIYGGIGFLAFSADGATLTAGSMRIDLAQQPTASTGALTQWDPATGKELWSIKEDPGFPIALAPDGRTAAFVAPLAEDLFSWQAELVARRTDSGRAVWRRKGEKYEFVEQARFSPDSKLLVVQSSLLEFRVFGGGGGRQVHHRLLEAATGGEVLKLDKKWDAIHFSPDGRTLAAIDSTDGQTVHLLDPRTGQARARLAGHLGVVHCLAFSADGKLLASGGADRLIHVWDLDLPGLRRPDPPGSGQEDLDQLWADLAAAQSARAYRSVWDLAAIPAKSVPLLRRHLRPVAPVPAATIEKPLRALESARFQERRLLKERPSLEVNRQVKDLLEKVDQEDLFPERLRHARAVAVLERAGTEEARQLLAELSKGAPGARQTEDARAALQRLDKLREPAKRPE